MSVAHERPEVEPVIARNFAPALPGLMQRHNVVETLATGVRQKVRFLQAAQPRPVDALSACSVSMGTPVAVEILCRFCARDVATPTARNKAAVITLNVFIGDKTPLPDFGFNRVAGSLFAKDF